MRITGLDDLLARLGAALGMLVLAAALALSADASAASASPEASAFLARLRVAAASPDAAAIADLVELPFLFEGKRHDRAGFVRQVAPVLFNRQVRACLARARPQAEDGRLVLWCKPYGFYLASGRDGWRLVEFVADGES